MMKRSRLVSTILFTLFVLLGILAYHEFLQVNILSYVNQQNIWDSRRFIAFLIFCAVSITFLVLAVRAVGKNKPFMSGLERIHNLPKGLRRFFSILITIIPPLIKWYAPLPETIDIGPSSNFFLMYCAALIASWLTGNEIIDPREKLLNVSAYWIGSGAAYAAFAKLVSVTSYPFPLYWSEGNRFFDYSALFGSFRYLVPEGQDLYTFISWGMQLPWALPFILPNLTIGTFRFWNQLMWILPGFLLGYTALKTFNQDKKDRSLALIFGLWAFIFLDQGPVYAPLVIAGILTMLGLRLKLIPAAVVIMLASYYAHESRWTWSYAPGLWAGLSALLMIKNPTFHKEKLKELLPPIVLGLFGLLGGRVLPEILPLVKPFINGFISKPAPVDSSSVSIDLVPNITASATRQPLLWERLYPNSTYPPGILLGIVWAALPIIILLVGLVIKKLWRPNLLQIASVLGVSVVFLSVGLTASVKIGGGSNLHNLDMFLITIFIVAAAALSKIPSRKNDPTTVGVWILALIAMVMVFPVTYILRPSEKPQLPLQSDVEESLSTIQREIGNISSREEILFIDHRHLLTFNLVPQVKLVDEYEKKKLMNEAMGADEAYFESFNEDISAQRFALIINEPLNVIIRGEDYAFGDENDAYVNWVTLPLTCSYEPIYTNFKTKVELLVPRSSPPPESLNCEDFIK
jgi:hypothetical protein